MITKSVKNKDFTYREFIKFLVAQGITVKTDTKARGNLGICFRNRIDISKCVEKDHKLRVLAHEYAHKVHFDIEGDLFSKGGTLERLFCTDSIAAIEKELFRVTNSVDPNSHGKETENIKEQLSAEISQLAQAVKDEYPDFKRSKSFKPADDYFKKTDSNARYFLKYDKVKLISPVLRKETVHSITDIDNEFAEVPVVFRTYLKLKSLERRMRRISNYRNRADKYYSTPTELFARFIEGIFLDRENVISLAPRAYSRFIELLNQGHFGKMKELFILADII